MFRLIVAICSFASMAGTVRSAIGNVASPSPPIQYLHDINFSNIIGKWEVVIINTQSVQMADDCLEYNFSDDSSGPRLLLSGNHKETKMKLEAEFVISWPDDSWPTELHVESDREHGNIRIVAVDSTQNLAILCSDFVRKPVSDHPTGAVSRIEYENVLLMRDISKLEDQHYDEFYMFLATVGLNQTYWEFPDHTVCP